MHTIAEALDAILSPLRALEQERLPLDRALGRFVASDLAARRDEPAFDNSAMDGYAVRFRDLASLSLPVHGESRAGTLAVDALREASAMRIFTGAPMPDGGDTVILQEDVDREGDVIAIRDPAREGENVRRRAEVIAVGALLLERGTEIRSAEIGLLASQGIGFVDVTRAPRVAILSTGDELRAIGEDAPPGTLFDSNAHALAAAVREAGGEPTILAPRRDDVARLREDITTALSIADLLVTTGGVSVGDYDLVPRALADAGLDEVIEKVRMKPGKPVRYYTRGDARAFGLPGNPVSAWVSFELFVRPAIRRLLGDPRPYRPMIDVVLAHATRGASNRTELARARLEPGDPPRAHLHPARGSAALTSLIAIDALLVLPEARGTLEAETRVIALDLRAARGVRDHRYRG